MNWNLFSRREGFELKGSVFNLLVYINCKEKVKPSSVVQLEESIGFKLCFK